MRASECICVCVFVHTCVHLLGRDDDGYQGVFKGGRGWDVSGPLAVKILLQFKKNIINIRIMKKKS